ncbi:MAG TPA: hydroxymethylglutaryl-CoA lyase [Acidimicrobiales bacterium]|nr:hydroxymethylglutaryl-CoA lyase [Acidimicrobiales bacterium]
MSTGWPGDSRMPGLPPLPDSVVIRDVGPRDGLQPERPVTPEDRVRLIEALVAAGVRRIEAVAFVSPKAVPAMAGAAEVLTGVPRMGDLRYTALVPNVRGAQMALETDVDELSVTISLSETYNQRNVKMSVDASVAEIEQICGAAGTVPVDAVVSCAFGSPYEGELDRAALIELVRRLRAVGCSAITCADTTGMATPRGIAVVVEAVGSDIGLHLHETRGTAMACAYAGLLLGVTRFDTSVGGLGGSPFAAGAAGNLATEGFVAMLDDLGVHSGIDVEALIEAASLVSELVGRALPSPVAAAGPRTRLAGPPGGGGR